MKIKKKYILLLFSLILMLITSYLHFRDYAVNNLMHKKTSQYNVLIHLVDKKLYLIDTDTGKSVKEYPIIYAKSYNSSIIGTWKIKNKSKLSDGFGVPWITLNLPFGKYSIHGTNSLTYIEDSSSHDCIRMFSNDVKDLYTYLQPSTFIVISSDPLDPID